MLPCLEVRDLDRSKRLLNQLGGQCATEGGEEQHRGRELGAPVIANDGFPAAEEGLDDVARSQHRTAEPRCEGKVPVDPSSQALSD